MCAAGGGLGTPGRAHARARGRQLGACSAAPAMETPLPAIAGLARVSTPFRDRTVRFPGFCPPSPLQARRALWTPTRPNSGALAPGQVGQLGLALI